MHCCRPRACSPRSQVASAKAVLRQILFDVGMGQSRFDKGRPSASTKTGPAKGEIDVFHSAISSYQGRLQKKHDNPNCGCRVGKVIFHEEELSPFSQITPLGRLSIYILSTWMCGDIQAALNPAFAVTNLRNSRLAFGTAHFSQSALLLPRGWAVLARARLLPGRGAGLRINECFLLSVTGMLSGPPPSRDVSARQRSQLRPNVLIR